MRKNYFLSLLLTFLVSLFSFGQIVINEVDADQTGTDTSEFIELKWTPNTALDGYVVVLFNGSDDQSYSAFDLDGKTTDANGFFILTTTSLATAADIDMGSDNTIQNGADAIAVYEADETDFPNDTPITLTGLIDVLVYGTSDSDDTGLLTGFGVTTQYDEGLNGNKDTESIQRHSDGSYQILAPSFRAENMTVNTPNISITGATNDQIFNPATTEVSITLNVANFTLSGDNGQGESNGQGDGFIKATLDVEGQTDPVANFFTTTPPNIEVTAGKTYTLTAELVDNAGSSLSPKVESIVSFSVATYTDVVSILGLRSGTEGNYYRLDGDNVTLTYARSSRNQKYIQDQTGGILIDDSAGAITTEYSTYAVMPILTGRLSSFRGVLQFVPDQDPGASQLNNDGFQPEKVALADYVANFENYESELITIDDISFSKDNIGDNFASSTNYDITSGETASIFRTNFSEADYIGTAIPGGIVNITAFGGEFNGTPQIIAINLAGIVLGVQQNQIEGFTTFPNPVANAQLTITSGSTASKVVSIYNVLGKQVFKDTFAGISKTLGLAGFSSGIYILKVVELGKIATKKLVIK